jgi:hypothetical protein
MTANFVPVGLQRFNYYIDQLQVIFEKAEGSEDPASIIFQENIRTPFFMLEALTRIYRKIHEKKIFTKLNVSFKAIEDRLGAIDYYDGFYKEAISKKNMPASVITYLEVKKEEQVTLLNDLLTDENWIGKKRKRIRKILEKLNEVPWLSEFHDMIEVKNVYAKYVNLLIDKFKNNEIQFNTIEEDVHELRRDLRWLSIYPQAFRGLMQLKPSEGSTPEATKYMTTEIINSPYNIMPDGSKLQDHILLNSNNFYALSWLIAELGKLKDNGLRVFALTDALTTAFNITKQQAEELIRSLNGETIMSIPEILEKSKDISTTFFKENNLDGLLV